MSSKLIVALAVAATASAASVHNPLPCPPVVLPEVTATSEPTETESATDIEVPWVCSNLPPCLEGVMVPNVAYNVTSPLYECAKIDNCSSMKVWCEPKKHVTKAGQEFDFWYACYDMPAVPKKETCEVEGKKYTVGVAYENVKYDGEKVDYLWCLGSSEDDVVTCSGSECGSMLELTPPGIKVQSECLTIVEPIVPVNNHHHHANSGYDNHANTGYEHHATAGQTQGTQGTEGHNHGTEGHHANGGHHANHGFFAM